jgi:L-rhamnose mutarotase
MALGLKELDCDSYRNSDSSIIGIDPWSNSASIDNYDSEDANYKWWNALNHEAIFQGFLKALKDYDVEKYSKYIRKRSNELSNEFEDESIDILHQDGNHTENISSEEVLTFYNKVKHGGYWIMDDTNWETTKKAQELIISLGFELIEDYNAWKIYRRLLKC